MNGDRICSQFRIRVKSGVDSVIVVIRSTDTTNALSRGSAGGRVETRKPIETLARRNDRREWSRRSVIINVIVDQSEIEIIVWREEHIRCHHQEVVLALLLITRSVVKVLTTSDARGRELDRNTTHLRKIDQAFQVCLTVLCERAHHLTTPLTRGLGTYHVHQSTNGVAAEERPLRSAQHLYSLRIPHISEGASGGREVYTVLINRYRRIKTLLYFGMLHATNRDPHRAVTQNRVNDQIGGHAGNIITRPCKRFFDSICIHGRHGDGHILHVFLALLCCNYYFFDLRRSRSLCVHLGRNGHGYCDSEN